MPKYDYSTESVVADTTASVTMMANGAGEEIKKNNMLTLNYRTQSQINTKPSKLGKLLSFSALGNDSPTSSDAEEEYARQQKLRLE